MHVRINMETCHQKNCLGSTSAGTTPPVFKKCTHNTLPAGSLALWNHLGPTQDFWEKVEEDRKFIGNKLVKKALKWLLYHMMFLKCLMNHNQIYVINRRWTQIYGDQMHTVACSHIILCYEPVRPSQVKQCWAKSEFKQEILQGKLSACAEGNSTGSPCLSELLLN